MTSFGPLGTLHQAVTVTVDLSELWRLQQIAATRADIGALRELADGLLRLIDGDPADKGVRYRWTG